MNTHRLLILVLMLPIFWCWKTATADESRFAHSDSNARYIHWIDLYDIDNRKITPDSVRPYSSMNTCGRCHDYEKISHGWHFNAFAPQAAAGREGEPWIWTDPRTATQLPLSYRDWDHTFDPNKIGISPWAMTRQFGSRLPGGGVAAEVGDRATKASESNAEGATTDENSKGVNRWPLSGTIEIDCMVCHASSGVYDMSARRAQIDQENFAWAATAAIHLGTVDGNVSRIKDGSDPNDQAVQEKLPKVTYEASRFSGDGTVFMDLIREPESNACYQCHSQRLVSDSGIEPRWVHDEDVHLRAGMVCADCHRNGIDHHIVRGFDGEDNPSAQAVVTFSCAGCHLGQDQGNRPPSVTLEEISLAGRLGSPRPLHQGLPPIHFEKMSCTACHGGPPPREAAIGLMTSLAHGLGEKEHRSGHELPAIVGPVYTKGEDGRVYPHRAMWPAFWGVLQGESVKPIPPEQVYEITRRALRVRNSFVDEILKPKVGGSDLKEILGEERAKVAEDQWTEDESSRVRVKQAELGEQLFNEKVAAALEAIEKELAVSTAVYVSTGIVYARSDKPDSLKTVGLKDKPSTQMVTWPLAHNVRGAGRSLGVTGCVECHSDDGKIFASTVTAIGPGPAVGQTVTMASLQGVDPNQQLTWNELFRSRASFKYVVGGSILVLCSVLLIGIGAMASRMAGAGGTSV